MIEGPILNPPRSSKRGPIGGIKYVPKYVQKSSTKLEKGQKCHMPKKKNSTLVGQAQESPALDPLM